MSSTRTGRFETADRLHSAAIRLLRRLALQDKRSGIGPAQLSALSVLVFAGAKSLGELAAAERVRPATMSRVVAGLRRAGLARVHPAPADQRRLRIEATATGIRRLQAARRQRVRRLAGGLQACSVAELRRIRRVAELILQVAQKL